MHQPDTKWWLATISVASLMLSGCAQRGDPARGEQVYVQCAACHTLTTNAVGPKHCGLFGRTAGTVPGFEYSKAMLASGIVWDEQTLDEFLTDPLTYVSGTSMGSLGLREESDRADVIAWLRQANSDPEKCPQ
jgi:cytochrome c